MLHLRIKTKDVYLFKFQASIYKYGPFTLMEYIIWFSIENGKEWAYEK
jgi:hypothetical protein